MADLNRDAVKMIHRSPSVDAAFDAVHKARRTFNEKVVANKVTPQNPAAIHRLWVPLRDAELALTEAIISSLIDTDTQCHSDTAGDAENQGLRMRLAAMSARLAFPPLN
jgi:hypothetical protein